MNKNRIVKLTLIDIFPSLEEIEEQNSKEEISIIFQGLNIFYNLKDLLVNKKDIYINQSNQKNTLLISLVQSINILANGLLSLKTGKQWVTFSYENKKKNPSSNLAFNLMDCIKININCLIIFNNSENHINSNYNHKTFNKSLFSKKETKKNLVHKNTNVNSKKIITSGDNKIINNKYKHNKSQEHHIINSYNYNGRESTENDTKYIFKSKKDYNNIKNINSFSTNGKDNKKFELNSSLSLSSNKFNQNFHTTLIEKNKMYSTIRQKMNNFNSKLNNSIYDNASTNVCDFEIDPKIEVKEEHNLLKKNKTNNQIKINMVHKKQKSCNILNIVDNKTDIRYRNSKDKNRLLYKNVINNKIAINNTVIRKKSKNNMISNSNYPLNIDRNYLYNISSNNTKSTFKKNELMNSFQKDNNTNNNIENNFITEKKNLNNFNNLNINNINNTSLFISNNEVNAIMNNSISEKNYDKIKTLENMDNITLENDNYNKLKEDILLLYNNEYVQNIKEDLLKLEIELFVEKMTELTNEYHVQLYDRLLEYQIEKNKYHINLFNYAHMKKLYNKLKSIRDNKEIKRKNINENDAKIKKQNNDLFNVNKNEINLYKILFSNNNKNNKNIENKNKLKKLLNIILNKNNNKNLINLDKNSQKLINYLSISKTIENNNSKIRARIIPRNQQTNYNNNYPNLSNSYVLENTNDKYDNKLNEVYSKIKIFSPLVTIKENRNSTINRIKNKFEN